MKLRMLQAIAVALLALLTMGFALAEGDGFTGTVPLPEYVPEVSVADGLRSVRNAIMKAAGKAAEKALTFAKPEKTGTDFEEDTVWTVTPTGGSGHYRYRFYLENKIDPNGGLTNDNVNLHGCRDEWSEDNTFSYRLVVPGIYFLAVFVEDMEETDDSGKPLSVSLGYRYDVVDDTRPTAAQKAAELAGECLAEVGADATDYEKALWLHDWITRSAYYSQGQHYYSEDGVLIRGEGVCDSYCKAYRLLLNEVGIDCDRIFGQSRSNGVNHAWNRVKLEGEWYQVDPTWDDPGSITEPVSNKERHLYFGLTDALMLKDHIYSPDAGKPCGTLGQNYFIRQGYVSQWMAELKCEALDRLEAGGSAAEISASTYISATESLGEASGKAYIPAALMNWVLAHENAAPEIAYLDAGERWIVYAVTQAGQSAWPVLRAWAMRIFTPPEALTTLGDSAFENSDALEAVMLPEDMSSIGARAFAGCDGLRAVFIPVGVSRADISENAFADSPNAIIYCIAGSGAETYAREKGIPFRACEDENP